MFLWDAWPRVCHRYDNLVISLTGRDSDRALLGRELDRITDQVGNYLSYAMSIDCNKRKIRWYVDLECLPLRFSQSSHAIDHRHHRLTQPVCRYQNRKSPALNFGKVEKISDQNLHLIGRTLNLINEFLHLVRINPLKVAK